MAIIIVRIDESRVLICKRGKVPSFLSRYHLGKRQESFLGFLIWTIPRDKLLMLGEHHRSITGKDIPISSQLSGWFNEGYQHDVAKDIKVIRIVVKATKETQ